MARDPDPSRGSRGGILVALSAVLALLIGLGGLAGVLGIKWVQDMLNRNEVTVDLPTAAPDGGSPCEDGGDCNYLVLGSDSRAALSKEEQREFQSDAQIDGYRSDTMLLVTIDPSDKTSTIVSIPRDTLVEIPGVKGLPGYGNENLVNAAFAAGGEREGMKGAVELAATTVSDMTGLSIDHVVVIDLGAFKAIVDALDGVRFCTPVSLVDDPQAFGEGPENGGSGLNLAAGCHELDGDDALALVRARYVVAGGSKDCISDFARISRQQQFMRAMMNKALSPAQVTNLPALLTAATEELTFDQGIDVLGLKDLANAMQGVASGNADFRTLPTQLDRNLTHLEITKEGDEFLRRLREGEDLGDLGTQLDYQAPTPAEIAVRVYDDASEGHAQGDVWDAQLSGSGFKLLTTAPEPAGDLAGNGTVILFAKGAEDKAAVVSGAVPGVKTQLAEPGQLPDDTDVAVLVDATYEYQDPGAGKTEVVETPCPFT